MPCWYFEKEDLRNTPSIQCGMDIETERRYRKEGTRFIMECGTAMTLGHHTIATGAVYFHRFYMFHTFQEFPRYVTACCCLFLAGKVEETPKKCRDIIATARSMLPDQKFQAFSDDLRRAKEEVMTMESILLQTIKFDLEVEHPYNFLVSYAKCLKGDKSKLQKMVQMAWNFVNDSLSTTVCLQWEPEIIAVALIHLASKLSKFTPTDWIGRQPHHCRWWDMFISGVTMDILEGICHQVLDLYQQNSSQTTSADGGSPSNQSSTSTTTTSSTSITSSTIGTNVNKFKNHLTATNNSPNAQIRLTKDIQSISQQQSSSINIENGSIQSSAFDSKGNRLIPTNSTNPSIMPPLPLPPIAARASIDNFRCDPGVYPKHIQEKNSTFYEHMNVNQALPAVPPPIQNGYSSYTAANQQNAIYPSNPQMIPSNATYNTVAPQCAQQPPHNIYYNSRISGAYYPGP